MRICVVLTALVCAAFFTPSRADAQGGLTFAQPVTGRIQAGGSAVWSFEAQSGAVVSLRVEATTADFDPVLTITDAAGGVLLVNDDMAYPDELDALVQAYTVPRTGSYRAVVSGFGSSQGSYRLTLTPGYADIAEREDFTTVAGWRAPDASVIARGTGGAMQLTASDDAGIVYGDLSPVEDFYAQIRVSAVEASAGRWRVGMAGRRANDDYYLFQVDDQGLWRFSRFDAGAETVLRDWTPHPNIVAGRTAFTLGMMARGVGFDFFYDGGYIGSADDGELTGTGEVGLMVAGHGSSPGDTAVTVDDLLITVPLTLDGDLIVPQQVSIGDSTFMTLALKRNHAVAPDGAMSLTVPESVIEFGRAGVNRLMLGGGTAYTNFALGASVTINAGGDGPAGCGLVFRYLGETDYLLAYVDQTGGYGLSQRDGDEFLPGLFGENPTLGAGEHHLLVIANETTLFYYIDGMYAGTLDAPAEAGQVGGAVVNFTGMNTTCRFANLWLWGWD